MAQVVGISFRGRMTMSLVNFQIGQFGNFREFGPRWGGLHVATTTERSEAFQYHSTCDAVVVQAWEKTWNSSGTVVEQ